jgi:hypothetical protein
MKKPNKPSDEKYIRETQIRTRILMTVIGELARAQANHIRQVSAKNAARGYVAAEEALETIDAAFDTIPSVEYTLKNPGKHIIQHEAQEKLWPRHVLGWVDYCRKLEVPFLPEELEEGIYAEHGWVIPDAEESIRRLLTKNSDAWDVVNTRRRFFSSNLWRPRFRRPSDALDTLKERWIEGLLEYASGNALVSVHDVENRSQYWRRAGKFMQQMTPYIGYEPRREEDGSITKERNHIVYTPWT